MNKKNFVELEDEQDVRDCKKSPVENSISTNKWLDPSIFSGIDHPVSKRRRGLEVQQRTEEYEVMHKVAKGLHNSDSMDNMLKTAMNAIATSKAFNIEKRAEVFHDVSIEPLALQTKLVR